MEINGPKIQRYRSAIPLNFCKATEISNSDSGVSTQFNGEEKTSEIMSRCLNSWMPKINMKVRMR